MARRGKARLAWQGKAGMAGWLGTARQGGARQGRRGEALKNQWN